ncbi:cytochrome P450 82A3-like [Durio zibethinus]|uniref:Cytochrome P450 82A3-like n=1 Tax=Durio zibethinus TaxID=66656 RepID=A0A6P5ZNF9_DURZI|nr:cytochrome P450 82A3-like [Durio zibethinus]
MDCFHPCPATSTVAMIAFPVLLFLFSLLWISKTASRKTSKMKTAPEAGSAWPVIGHLRLLRGPQPVHISLANMAEKYGTIFTIKLGVHRALLVSNWEIAKECLTINDKALANRPKLVGLELLGYNNAMIGTAPYGPYCCQVRKFVTAELLSNHRIEMLKHVMESEVKTSLEQLYQLWNKKRSNSDKVLLDMKRCFKEVTLNVILSIIVGKQIPNSSEGGETVKWTKLLDDFFEQSGKFVVSDAVPFLRWFDIGGEEKLVKKTAKELEQVIEGRLREHKRKRAANEAKSEEDFMGVMLSILRDVEEHDADTINKATSLSLILAAEDTTSTTMTWALSLLLNNREELKKVQQELDIQVGMDRLLVTESDTKNLVYLQSIVKETLRLYPAAPLSVIHEAIEDCTVFFVFGKEAIFHQPRGAFWQRNHLSLA